jgi:hypothetical protein
LLFSSNSSPLDSDLTNQSTNSKYSQPWWTQRIEQNKTLSKIMVMITGLHNFDASYNIHANELQMKHAAKLHCNFHKRLLCIQQSNPEHQTSAPVKTYEAPYTDRPIHQTA